MQTRLNSRTLFLLLSFIVLGVYYPALFAPVNSVDDVGMYHFLLNLDDFSLRDIFFPGGKGTYYRPILLLSFLFDKYVWGLEESFMHLDNILLHLLNTILVFAVALRGGRLLDIASPFPAFLAALFFSIHPINTESVAWISGRTDLLAGFFILLSVYILLISPNRFLVILLSAICLLLACLAKETAIFVLPAMLIFPFFQSSDRIDRMPFRAILKNSIFHFAVFILMGALYVAFRLAAFDHGDEGMSRFVSHAAGGDEVGLLLSVKMVLKAAGFYLKKLFVPFPLNFAIVRISDLYLIPGIILCIALLWILARRRFSGFFFIAAASLSVSGLMIPLLRVTWTPLAERYMYIPSMFFLVGLTYAVQQWPETKKYPKIVTTVLASVIAVFLWGTAQRNIVWQDNLTLFEDTNRKSPDFVPAQNEMARALYGEGKGAEAGSILKSLKVSSELNNYQYGMISKAGALENEGDTEGARKILRKLLADPGRHEVLISQRLLKLNEQEVLAGKAEINRYFEENVMLMSRLYEITRDPFYQYRLGQTYMFKGDRANARSAFQRVVVESSEKVYYHNPARILLKKMER